ncbi:MAG: SH3 domain-containing protein [Beijerinckiaceae bacterium]|nr:SH3 domain-containing protein [Beijerinckiaceae bacterium]
MSTGLVIPRYVSLKSGTVRMRRGPSKEHGVVWTYTKAGLPVEITAEYENWRKVRDWEGSEGWVFHTLLSGRRTVMVAPWQKQGVIDLHKDAAEESAAVARVGPNVVAKVRACDKVWCRISGDGFDGFIRQKLVWGVYPDENLK